MAESEEAGPINLGNPRELDLVTLGHLVASALDVQAIFEFFELPLDDPKQRRPDIGLATKLLNWQPKISIEEGLRLTASWMKNQNL
jgi:dTDP-glucose 4,6-dehydratase